MPATSSAQVSERRLGRLKAGELAANCSKQHIRTWRTGAWFGMAHDPDLPFRVYCVRRSAGAREIVASFARYTEAEVFIHCELKDLTGDGADSARYWGAHRQGGQVYYWIESAHSTASARKGDVAHG